MTTKVTGNMTTGLAPLESPSFTGFPTVPTQTPLDNSTNIASTQYVDDAVAAINPTSTLVSSLNVDWSLGNVFYKSISTGTTFTFSNTADGKTISLAVINTSGADVAVAFPAGIKVKTGFSLSVPAGQANIYTFIVANSIIYATVVDGMV
jgi:hypothetical protein